MHRQYFLKKEIQEVGKKNTNGVGKNSVEYGSQSLQKQREKIIQQTENVWIRP